MPTVLTRHPDHKTIDLDSDAWQDLDETSATPLDDALVRVVAALDAKHRRREGGA
jgi:hypothetical protein